MERWLREREGDLLAHIEDDLRKETEMKSLRKADLRQWLWANLSSPVNTGTKIKSTPLYAFAECQGVDLPKRLPQWARRFDEQCSTMHGTLRGATAYHMLLEILGEERS